MMVPRMRIICSLVAAALVLFSFAGCAAFRAQTEDVSVDDMEHYKADYDATDMRKITQSVVDKIVASAFLAEEGAPPIMMIAGVENRTSEYVDTKNLTDRVRTLLFQTGKVQFVNEARRKDLLAEQAYQAEQATAETQAAIGRQLGAKYMITGSLTEMTQETPRQVRVSKTKMNYYKLTFEVTNLETGLIAWITEDEFARKARTPIVGW